MNPNYKINFVIPQGPTGPQGIQGVTGPTGPTGPTGETTSITAYGGRYNTAGGNISLAIATPTQVPLATNMPNLNTTYTTANAININQGGVYEINYYVNLSVAVGTTLTLSVRNNGTNIASTVISKILSVGTSSVYSGSVIVNLNANSVIDMALSALVAVGVSLGSGSSASLTVKKLSSN